MSKTILAALCALALTSIPAEAKPKQYEYVEDTGEFSGRQRVMIDTKTAAESGPSAAERVSAARLT